MNDVSIKISGEILQSMLNDIKMYGVIQEDGRSLLSEVSMMVSGFKATIYTNESQHRGRPHCKISANGKSATFDIETGNLMVGDIRPLNRTVEKVVLKHRDALLKLWNDSRPDDQRLQ